MQYNLSNLPGPNNKDTWYALATLLIAETDLIPAIVNAVFNFWPNDAPGEHFFEHKYTTEAPECQLLDAFRNIVSTRFLGSWDSKPPSGWAATHSRDEAVCLCIAIAQAFDDR